MEAGIIDAIANNSVMAVVLGWFMLRMEKHVQNNTKALEGVKEVIRGCRARNNEKV